MSLIRFTIPSSQSIHASTSRNGGTGGNDGSTEQEPFQKHFCLPSHLVAAHSNFVADVVESHEADEINSGALDSKVFHVISIDYGDAIAASDEAKGNAELSYIDIPLEPRIGHCRNDVVALLCEWMLHYSGASAAYDKPHEILHRELMAIPRGGHDTPIFQRCNALLPFTARTIGMPITPPALPSTSTLGLKPKPAAVKDLQANYQNNTMYQVQAPQSNPTLTAAQLHTVHQQQQQQKWQKALLDKIIEKQSDSRIATTLQNQLSQYQQSQAQSLTQSLTSQQQQKDMETKTLLPNILTTNILGFFETVIGNQWEASFVIFSILFGEETHAPLESGEELNPDERGGNEMKRSSWQEKAFNETAHNVAGTTAAHLIAPSLADAVDKQKASNASYAIDPAVVLRFHRRLYFLGSIALFLDIPRLLDLVSLVTASLIIGVMQARVVGANGSTTLPPLENSLVEAALAATNPDRNVGPKPFAGDGFTTIHSKAYGTSSAPNPTNFNPTHMASENQATFSPFAHIRSTATGGEAEPQASRALNVAISLERQATVREWFAGSEATQEGNSKKDEGWFTATEQERIKERFSYEETTV